MKRTRTPVSGDPPDCTCTASAVHTIWSIPAGVTSSAASGVISSISSSRTVTVMRWAPVAAIPVSSSESPGPESSRDMASEIEPSRPVSRTCAVSSPCASRKYRVTPGATPVGASPPPATSEGPAPQAVTRASTAAAAVPARLTAPPPARPAPAAPGRSGPRSRCRPR